MTDKNNKLMGKLIFSIIFLLIYPVLLLFLADDWLWPEGWVYNIWFIVLSTTSLVYLFRKDPALLAERFKISEPKNQKTWDKYFIYLIIIIYTVWFTIMPLDAKRFGWTAEFPLWLKALGGVGLLISFFFLYRSYTDNTFLSPLIRIQTERKQQVVSTGVYGFVRHPMYLGSILMFLGVPMLLGSKYGILVGSALSLLLIVRILGEEKMLVQELEGYSDYKKKVKYRLIPFIW